MTRTTRARVASGAAAASLLMLSGCTSTEANDAAGSIAVSSTDDACRHSAAQAPAGRIVFQVTNDGSQVTEFYVYAEDGQRVVGEVENVGPGQTRDLAITATPGTYVTACKPGMAGEGIRTEFTVTG